ncbi:MAG: hypothetical protein IKF71_02705 [Bacilli bacterium]|nr:hypothetical protein [Bacilli bacterium]
MENNEREKIAAIKECLIEYVGPIYICGEIFDLNADSLTIIHADMPKEELIILNNHYPEWIKRVINNENKKNVLLIKDFDKISLEDQKLFVDIICKNRVSSELLPENLKIMINSNERCSLIPEIREVIQYFEV